jgi:hypothetical protein
MNKQTREKIALLVFAILVILGGSILLRYFETGRTFNVAASAVDDAFGQMSGYTALVFDGTVQNTEGGTPIEQPEAGASVEGSSGETEADAAQTYNPTSVGDMVAYELSKLPLVMRERPVYTSDVREIYEEKGAGAVTLNLKPTDRYATPLVMNAGDKKVGVVSIDYYASNQKLKQLQTTLKDEGAQVLVAIVPRLSFAESLTGFNVVIVSDDSQAEAGTSKMVDNALVMYSPQQNEVGVILLSGANVASSKVYASL